jgi:hypothetical protein
MSAARALLLCACLALPAAAAENSARPYSLEGAGTTGAQFLKMASGARGAALGEAFTAAADDAFALDWNPAGLIGIERNSLVFMHAPYLADTSLDFIAYAENAGEVGSWGLAAKRMDYGKLRRTDSSGLDSGSFNPSDLSLAVGLACYITGFNLDPEERFVLGATGKMVRSSIVRNDSTLSADIGLLSPWLFEGTFRAGLVAQNVMGSLRFDREEALLPLVLRLGGLVRLGGNFTLTVDAVGPRDNLPFLAAGLETRFKPQKRTEVFLRGGFNTRAVADLSGTHNVALGAGVRYGDYALDYAISPFGQLGNVHRISLSMTFSPAGPKR